MGASGSGKDTLVTKWCSDCDMKKLKSYTTRPIRLNDSEDKNNHIFVTQEEFDKLENLIAYTNYNGYEYCATSEQVDANNFYIIDPSGVKAFKKNYKGYKIPIIIYLDVDENVRRNRMKARGDSVNDINLRLENDRHSFSKSVLDSIDIDITISNNDTLLETPWGESIFTKYGSSKLRAFSECLHCANIMSLID